MSKKLLYILATILIIGSLPAEARRAKKKKEEPPKVEDVMAQLNDAFFAYDIDLAEQKIEVLRTLPEGISAEQIDSIEQRVNRMSEMIQRVEDIVVIDSLTLHRDDFFRHYRMASSAGTLSSPEEHHYESADSTIFYTTQNKQLMIWGGQEGLLQSRSLTDGTREDPTPLSDVLNHGGIANYPFLLSDGITLYFATKGTDSLGGLDLYMTRSDRDNYAIPQNLGMPYNSPYDDYMLAIDEETGIGWFATDRNRLGDLITVYIFIPNSVRKNLSLNTINLKNRARLTSIADTQNPDEDYSNILQNIANIKDDSASAPKADFILAFPNGTVYKNWSDFKSPQARRLMETYIDAQAEIQEDAKTLETLRLNYKPGDSKTDNTILSIEKKLKQASNTLRRLSNQVINTELK